MKNKLENIVKKRLTIFYFLAFSLWILPVLTLVCFGLFYLWVAGWLWWFSCGLLCLTSVSWVFHYALSRPETETETEFEHLDPQPDWSERDNRVWQKSLANIEKSKLVGTSWESIPRMMLDQTVFVARAYHGDDADVEYAFTLPELLLMLETWSCDYRAQIIENVPLIQEVKISTIMGLSRKADKAQRLYNYVAPIIKVVQVGLNPATGLMGEAKSQLASKIFGDLSLHMQRNLKILLFEQVSQVAINLYSGRLKLSDSELSAFQRNQVKPKLEKMTPLSVTIVGQVNAGKSSLINALQKRCVAEIDVLPATAGFHYHHMLLTDDLEMYLIDTPGLDGETRTLQAVLDKAVKTDLLVWVSRANQQAKALDRQLVDKWNSYFEKNLNRRKPPILLVTTHNDKLKPTGDWHPPYDLTCHDDAKVISMLGALEYTRESFGLPEDCLTVPISLLPDDQSYNLDTLEKLLLTISDQARGAQLNRQRLDADGRASVILRGLQQCGGLVKSGVVLVFK